MRLVSRLKHWLAPAPSHAEASIPFAVSCAAGHMVRGVRKRRHQVVRCGECGQSVFVLPRSPFISLDRINQSAPPPRLGSPWRRPVVAAVLTLLVVAGALAIFFSLLERKPGGPDSIQAHITAGQTALGDGRPRRAADEFDAAQKLLALNREGLSPARVRELSQWQRQAHLLADLLTESLTEILLRASRSNEEEWLAQFQQRFKGAGKANAVIFAMDVRRDGAGQYHHDLHLEAGIEPARLEIGDLTALHSLPLATPTQVLFGARLGSIAREQNGVWVVRFEPNSGVLLTDLEAARAYCPLSMHEDLPEILERQRQWLEGR